MVIMKETQIRDHLKIEFSFTVTGEKDSKKIYGGKTSTGFVFDLESLARSIGVSISLSF